MKKSRSFFTAIRNIVPRGGRNTLHEKKGSEFSMSTLLQHERCSLLKGRFLPTTYIFSTRKMSTSNFFHPTVFNRPKLNVVKNYPLPSPSLDLIILLMRSLDHATYFNLKTFQKKPDHRKIIFCTIWCHNFSMVFIKDFKSVLIKCEFSPIQVM